MRKKENEGVRGRENARTEGEGEEVRNGKVSAFTFNAFLSSLFTFSLVESISAPANCQPRPLVAENAHRSGSFQPPALTQIPQPLLAAYPLPCLG